MGFSILAGEDAADEWDWVRRGRGQGDSGFEEREGLGEHVFSCGVESGDGLAFFDVCAAACVEENAGVWIDGLACFLAACSGALNGPADRGGVHGGDETGIPGGEDGGSAGGVEAGGMVEDGDIATLGVDHLEEEREGGAVVEGGFGELVAGVRGFGFAAEVDHPAGEDEGELTEVFALGRALAAEKKDRFDDFDPVAGGGAEGLAHVSEEGDGAGSGGLGRGDHEGGEEFGVILLTQKGAGAGFYVEDEGVEAGGEFFGENAGADEAGVFDGGGKVAEGIEDAVSGDERRGLADDGTAAAVEDGFELVEGERGAEAGDGF